MLATVTMLLGAALATGASPKNDGNIILAAEAPDSATLAGHESCINAALSRIHNSPFTTALQPRTSTGASHRSFSELDGLLLAGIRSAEKQNWGSAINELQEVADALDAPDAPAVGRERLLEARIRLGRAWLDAHAASTSASSKHAANAPWRSKRIARDRAEEQFRAALQAIPTYAVSPDLYPPAVIESIESVRRSMLAAGQPVSVQVNLPGATAELVVDGYLRGRGPATVWPGQHEIRVVDRSAAGVATKGAPLPDATLGPIWSAAVPPEGLTLRLSTPHARCLAVVEDESLERYAVALGASQAIVIPQEDTIGGSCGRPQLVDLDQRKAPISADAFENLWPTESTQAVVTTPPAKDAQATEEVPTEDLRWAWATTGVAIASLAAGGILGSLALADEAKLAGMERYDPGLNSLKNRVDGEALAADVFLGLGAAAAVATIVLFVIEGPPDDEPGVTLAPVPLEAGAGARAQVRW